MPIDARVRLLASGIAADIKSMTRRGNYSARPAATAVYPNTRYIADDVGEEYLSTGTAWIVVGSSEELAYAEQIPLVSVTGSSPTVIPGLTATFRAGERPVLVDLNMRLANSGAGSVSVVRVLLNDVESFRIEHNNYSASTWNSVSSARTLRNLTPGANYTVSTTLSVATGLAGTALTAGDATNPNNLSIRNV